MEISKKERAKGALMGAFIGEALGVGPHWYYDLEEMRAEYGEWIDEYTEPKPDRYHGGLQAGEISQAGFSAIPQRFIDGLQQKDELLGLSDELAEKL